MQFFTLAGQVQTSRIALGGNVFGYFTDQAQTADVIDAAQDVGINFIDTADVYSDGASESLIGKILGTRRNQWVLASKVGLRSDEKPEGLGQSSLIRQKLEASLLRLQTHYIDLYQMHHFDPVTPIEETLGCLDGLYREGKIRAYGVSNYSKTNLETICTAAKQPSLTFPASVQCHYNLFARSAEDDLFPLCHQFNLHALAYGVLARGLLSAKYSHTHAIPASSRASVSTSLGNDLKPDVLIAVQQMARDVADCGLTLAQAALIWSLRLPTVGAAVVGMRTPQQVTSLSKALDLLLPEIVREKLEALGRHIGLAHPSGFGAPAVLQKSSSQPIRMHET